MFLLSATVQTTVLLMLCCLLVAFTGLIVVVANHCTDTRRTNLGLGFCAVGVVAGVSFALAGII